MSQSSTPESSLMSTSPSSLASASSKDDVSSSGVSSSAISTSGSGSGGDGIGGGRRRGGDATDELHQWNGGGGGGGEDEDEESMRLVGGDRVDDRCSPIMLGSEASGGLTMLSSLDCWDYTIELECLRGGPEGYSMFIYFFCCALSWY